jgi:hypothetical protein
VGSHVYIQDINKMEKEKMVFMFKMSHHEEIMSFKLVIHMVIMVI